MMRKKEKGNNKHDRGIMQIIQGEQIHRELRYIKHSIRGESYKPLPEVTATMEAEKATHKVWGKGLTIYQ